MDIERIIEIKNDIDLLIEDIDPSTKTSITQDTILTSSYNKKLLREISEILLTKISIYNYLPQNKISHFYLDKEKIKTIPLSEDPISISSFTYTINNSTQNENMEKLKATQITSWLVQKGYLKVIYHQDGKEFKMLTIKSSSIGMSSIKKQSPYGREYEVNLYNESAQKFILANINEIAD